jgi:DNA-directed RNA polymerase subunit beta'
MYRSQGNTFQQIEIGLASPKEIRSWAERFLPTGDIVGEVTSWETVNYKTLKPEPNGLFCQKIFGPVIDYTCACGKKALKITTGFCPKCGVERTSAQVRRYRMGYVRLKQPVAHTLYASQKPSPLGLCLNWPNKRLQAVLYGTEFCQLPETFEYFIPGINLPSPELIPLNIVSVKKTTPRLFRNIEPFYTQNTSHSLKNNILKSPNLCQQKLRFGVHIYGIGYDMTWRQVEDLQDFLVYIWEQPQNTDNIIPYYNSTLQDEKIAQTTIPSHPQYYPLQTGGFVFQQIFMHSNLVGIQRQLALDLEQIKISVTALQLRKKNRRNLPKSEWVKLLIELNRFKELEKKLLRRFTYFRDFHKAQMQPAWMMLSYLPILPPALRPITSIRGELVVSDLNSLYRKVLTRNRRLTNTTRFGIFDTALSGSWASWCYNLRQVQEAVDSLLKTGKVDSGKTTKSLLDALKGKRGRFRQHLLGKRVDYSGRSVIVVGPKLKIHECGLPKQMAVELFQPFLIQQLRNKGIAFTTTGAKALILERKPIIWTLLREILQSHPVFLNRAPTLHRLGIQSFLPKLVEGKAILLHPLVCPAFNADFDGDQMAVHVPLSGSARAEAFNLLLARNHLLAPSSGEPLLLPTQDMVLGCYYLTISKEMIPFNKVIHAPEQKDSLLNKVRTDEPSQLAQLLFSEKKTTRVDAKTPLSYTVNVFAKTKFNRFTREEKTHWYSGFSEVMEEYYRSKLSAHTPIWVCFNKTVQNLVPQNQSQQRDRPLELRFEVFGKSELLASEHYENEIITKFSSTKIRTSSYIRTTPGRILLYNLMTRSNEPTYN